MSASIVLRSLLASYFVVFLALKFIGGAFEGTLLETSWLRYSIYAVEIGIVLALLAILLPPASNVRA